MFSKNIMIKTKDLKTQQKHFLIKAYPHSSQLEIAIKKIKENSTSNLQLSILGKFTKEYISKSKEERAIYEKELKHYWNGLLGSSQEFGLFKNPELGTVFIAGSLTSMFLHKIEGKALGAMSAGSYGILRGLGAYQLQAESYLKLLTKGSYLLIVRGYDDELNSLEVILAKLDKE